MLTKKIVSLPFAETSQLASVIRSLRASKIILRMEPCTSLASNILKLVGFGYLTVKRKNRSKFSSQLFEFRSKFTHRSTLELWQMTNVQLREKFRGVHDFHESNGGRFFDWFTAKICIANCKNVNELCIKGQRLIFSENCCRFSGK